MAIVARHNAISQTLSTAPQHYAPIFQRTDNGVVFAGPWCMGFAHMADLIGIRMLRGMPAIEARLPYRVRYDCGLWSPC